MTGILLIPLLASLLNSTFSFCIDTKYHIFLGFIQSYYPSSSASFVDSSSSLILGYTSAQTLLLFPYALLPLISSSAMTLNIMDTLCVCAQLCPTRNPMDCHPRDSSVHGIF